MSEEDTDEDSELFRSLAEMYEGEPLGELFEHLAECYDEGS